MVLFLVHVSMISGVMKYWIPDMKNSHTNQHRRQGLQISANVKIYLNTIHEITQSKQRKRHKNIYQFNEITRCIWYCRPAYLRNFMSKAKKFELFFINKLWLLYFFSLENFNPFAFKAIRFQELSGACVLLGTNAIHYWYELYY